MIVSPTKKKAALIKAAKATSYIDRTPGYLPRHILLRYLNVGQPYNLNYSEKLTVLEY